MRIVGGERGGDGRRDSAGAKDWDEVCGKVWWVLLMDFGGGWGRVESRIVSGSEWEVLSASALLCVVDALDDSVAFRSSTNLLPLFRAAELVSEKASGVSNEVSSGVGARYMPARWERRLKRSIQARSMEGRKRRMKISMPTSYICQLYTGMSMC